VKNGFLFQSSVLGDILSETNRTFEQNATLISGINSLTAQVRSSSFFKIYSLKKKNKIYFNI
jgi:hypothetical protein